MCRLVSGQSHRVGDAAIERGAGRTFFAGYPCFSDWGRDTFIALPGLCLPTGRFADALTLTHNATSLILPGGASITTAAGDVAGFRSLGSGNWRCEFYSRASGAAVVTHPIANGGSGSTTASAARTALAVTGLADVNSFSAANNLTCSGFTSASSAATRAFAASRAFLASSAALRAASARV